LSSAPKSAGERQIDRENGYAKRDHPEAKDRKKADKAA